MSVLETALSALGTFEAAPHTLAASGLAAPRACESARCSHYIDLKSQSYWASITYL